MASDNDKDDDLNLVGYIDDMTLVENDNEDKEEGEISNGSSSSIGYNQMVLSHRSESILSLSDISSTKSYDEPLIRDMTLLDNDQPTESPSLHELELEKNKLIERIKSKLNTPNSSEKVMRDIEKLDIIKMSIAEIKSRGTDNPKLKHREKRKSKKSKKSSKRKKKSIIPSVAEQEFTNYSSSRLLAKPGIPPVHGVQEDELFPNLDEVINATPFTGGQNLKIAVRNDLFKHKVFNDSEIDSSIEKQKSISFYNPSSPTSSHSTAETISDLSELNCSREKLQYSCRDSREKLQWNVLQDPAVEFSEEKYSKRKKRHSRKKIKSPIKSHYSRDETMSPTLSQRRPSKSPHERHHSRIGQSKSTHPTSSLDTSPHKRHHSGSRQRRRPSDRSTSIHLKSRHSKHSRRKDRSRTYSSHSDSGSSSKGKSSSRRQQRRQCSRSASSSSSQSIEITKSVLTNQSVIRSPDKSADVSLFQGVNKSLLTFSSNERTPGTSQYSSSSPKVEAVPASSGLPNLNSSYNIPSLGLDLNRDISEHPKKPNLSQLVIPCHQQTSSSPSIVHAFHLESNCEFEDTNRNICDQSDVSNYDVISMDAGSDSLESDILLDNNNLSKPVMNNKSCEHVESTHPLNTMSVKERDTLENIPDKESDTLVYIPGKETDILENLPDKESDILENIPDKVSDTLGNIPDEKSNTLDNTPGKESDTLENLVKDQMHCNLSTNKCKDPTESLMNESCSRIASASNENQKVNNREIVVHELEIAYLLHNPAIPDYVANGSADFFAELQQVLCSACFNTTTKHDSLAIEKWFVIINSIYYDLIYKKNNTTFEKIKKYCHILDLFRDYFKQIVSQPKNNYSDSLPMYVLKLEAIKDWINCKLRQNETDGISSVDEYGGKFFKKNHLKIEKFLLKYHFNINSSKKCRNLISEKRKISQWKDDIAILFQKSVRNKQSISSEEIDKLKYIKTALISWKPTSTLLNKIEQIYQTIESIPLVKSPVHANENRVSSNSLKEMRNDSDKPILHISLESSGSDFNSPHNQIEPIQSTNNSDSRVLQEINNIGPSNKNVEASKNEESNESLLKRDAPDNLASFPVGAINQNGKILTSSSVKDVGSQEGAKQVHIPSRTCNNNIYEINNESITSDIPSLAWGSNLDCLITTNQSFLCSNMTKESIQSGKDISSDSRDPRLRKLSGSLEPKTQQSEKLNEKCSSNLDNSIVYKLKKFFVEIPFVRYRSQLATSYNHLDPRLKKDKIRLEEENEKNHPRNANQNIVKLDKAAISTLSVGITQTNLPAKTDIDSTRNKMNTKDPRLKCEKIKEPIAKQNITTEKEKSLGSILSKVDNAWSRIPFKCGQLETPIKQNVPLGKDNQINLDKHFDRQNMTIKKSDPLNMGISSSGPTKNCFVNSHLNFTKVRTNENVHDINKESKNTKLISKAYTEGVNLCNRSNDEESSKPLYHTDENEKMFSATNEFVISSCKKNPQLGDSKSKVNQIKASLNDGKGQVNLHPKIVPLIKKCDLGIEKGSLEKLKSYKIPKTPRKSVDLNETSTDVKNIKVNSKNSTILKPNLKCINIFSERKKVNDFNTSKSCIAISSSSNNNNNEKECSKKFNSTNTKKAFNINDDLHRPLLDNSKFNTDLEMKQKKPLQNDKNVGAHINVHSVGTNLHSNVDLNIEGKTYKKIPKIPRKSIESSDKFTDVKNIKVNFKKSPNSKPNLKCIDIPQSKETKISKNDPVKSKKVVSDKINVSDVSKKNALKYMNKIKHKIETASQIDVDGKKSAKLMKHHCDTRSKEDEKLTCRSLKSKNRMNMKHIIMKTPYLKAFRNDPQLFDCCVILNKNIQQSDRLCKQNPLKRKIDTSEVFTKANEPLLNKKKKVNPETDWPLNCTILGNKSSSATITPKAKKSDTKNDSSVVNNKKCPKMLKNNDVSISTIIEESKKSGIVSDFVNIASREEFQNSNSHKKKLTGLENSGAKKKKLIETKNRTSNKKETTEVQNSAANKKLTKVKNSTSNKKETAGVEDRNSNKELAEVENSNSDKKEFAEVEESNFDKELAEIEDSNSNKELAEVEKSNSDKKEFAEVGESNFDKELAEIKNCYSDKKELAEIEDSNSKKDLAEVENSNSDKRKLAEVEESNFDKELAEIKKSNSDKKELVEVEESNFDKELVEIKKSNSDKKELAKVEDSNSDKKEFAEIEEINSDKKELGEVEDSNFDKKEFVELNDSNSKEKESVQVEDGDSDKKVLSEIGNDPVNKKELDHSRNEDGKDCQNMNMSENIEYDRMKKSFAKTNAQVQIHRMTTSPKNLSSKDSPQRSLLTSAEYTESSLLENSFEAPTRGHAPKAISFKRMSLDSHSQINEESTVPIKLSFRRSSGDTWINLSKENLVDDRNEIVPNTKIGVHRFPASYAKLIAMENGKRHKQNVVNSPSKACHESKAIDFKSHQQSKETTLSELRSCTTERKGNESSVDLEKSSDNEALVYESKQHRPSQKSRKQKQLYDEYSSDEEEHDLRATDEDTDDISGITGINKGNGNITPLTNTNLVGDKSDNLKHEVVIKNKNQHDKLCASKAKKKKLGKFNIANFIKHKGSKKENVL